MTELLSALPALLSFQHRDDYAEFVRNAQADQMAQRAIDRTAQQMAHALQSVVRDEAEKDHRPSSAAN
jgi:hypothetical protein